MSVNVGAAAPDFKLKGFASPEAAQMEEFSLSKYKGERNVVLLFFPLVYTPVCTTEMCSIRDTISKYNDLRAQILGVSVDNPFAQKAWAKENKLNFPLISDFNKDMSRAYGAMYEELIGFKGVSKRSAFVIDKKGVVQFAWVSDDAKQLPDFNAIQACLAKCS
ncbi:MAG: redoxin domain-containing protein [Planctomycetes bacterium]|nr:redoxin domain-containing protein [Planctomycetota bacterium]